MENLHAKESKLSKNGVKGLKKKKMDGIEKLKVKKSSKGIDESSLGLVSSDINSGTGGVQDVQDHTPKIKVSLLRGLSFDE